MYFKLEAFGGLLFFCSLLAADPVSSVSCQVTGYPSIAALNGCGTGQSGYFEPSSGAKANYTFFGGPAPFTAAVETNTVSSRGLAAKAVAEVSSLFDSPGPLRAGYIQLSIPSLSVQALGETGEATVALKLGYLSLLCDNPGEVDQCTFYEDGVATYTHEIYLLINNRSTVTLPFVLGVPFGFDLVNTGSAEPIALIGSTSDTSSNVQVSFSLFEANGTTAVPLQAIPEPLSWPLIGLFCLACGALRGKLRMRWETA